MIFKLTVTCAALLALLFTVSAACAENASNPLAAVNNTDFRVQYYNLDGPELWDVFLADGSYMLSPKLKLKYEVHWWNTDITGSSESAIESVHLKPIYFPEKMVGQLGSWRYKTAIAVEVILDFDNTDKGIGSGSDQVAPFVGLAFARDKTVLIPLIQHFVNISGPDVNATAFRLIGLQTLENDMWAKLDAKIPIDWENDEAIPATLEAQLGKSYSPKLGVYADAFLGVGADRPYDWGVGLGVRLNY